MTKHPIYKWHWRAVTVVGAILYVGHAMFYDWSDVMIHFSIALAVSVSAVRWPRAAALSVLSLLMLVFVARAVVEGETLPNGLAPGISLSEARQVLGDSSYEFSTLEEARQGMDGYSQPSPLRFSHRGPVAIFERRGDEVIWVLHDGETTVGVYVGGT